MFTENEQVMGKRLELLQRQLEKHKRHDRGGGILLKLGFAITFLLYLAFNMHLYLGDPLSWSHYFNDWQATVGFSFMVVVVVLMSLFLAWVKHHAYLHFGMYGSVTLVVFTVIGFALFAEFFSSSANQDAKSNVQLENSSAFRQSLGFNPAGAVGSSGLSGEVAKARVRLAQCGERMRAGKERHCEGDKARVAALEGSERSATEAQLLAANAAMKENYARQDKLKADSYNPVIVWVAQVMASFSGAAYPDYIKATVVLVMLLVAACFEILHHFLSHSKGRSSSAVDAVEMEIARMVGGFGEGDVPRPARPDPAPASAGTSAATALFKWQALRPIGESIAMEYGRAQYGRERLNESLIRGIGKLSRPAPPAPVAVPDTAPTLPATPTVREAIRAGADIHQGKNQVLDGKPSIPADPAVAAVLPLPAVRLSLAGQQKPDSEDRPTEAGQQKPDSEGVAKKVAYIEQKLANQKAELESREAAARTAELADRTAAEASSQAKLAGAEAARKRAELALEAVVRTAKAETDRTAREAVRTAELANRTAKEKELANRTAAEADRTAKEAVRTAAEASAAAKAEADLLAAEQEAADRAERGTLTDGQIGLAANVIRNAITAGHITTLGSPSTTPILKAAGLPSSTNLIKALNKLACKVLEAEGLVILNPNKSRGQSLYIIA